MVKNPPCNTEDAGLILGQRTKIPHAAEQLNLRPPTAEPGVPQLESMRHHERSHMPQLRLNTAK